MCHSRAIAHETNASALLVGGPSTAADYLGATLQAGKQQLDWEAIKSQTGSYPLDGVAYHMYLFHDSDKTIGTTLTRTRAYLNAMSWAVPAALAFRVFHGFSTAVSRPRTLMMLNLFGLALKVPLNYVFMYGYFGAPEMGGVGCGVVVGGTGIVHIPPTHVWPLQCTPPRPATQHNKSAV